MQTNKQACKPLLPPTCGPARWPHAPLPCTASRQPRELEFWGLLREGKSFFTPRNAVGNFHAWSVSETVEGGETAMNFQQFGAAGSSRGHTCPALSQAAPCCFAGGSSLSPPTQGGFSLVGSVPPGLPVVQQPLVASQAAGTPQTGEEAASLRLQPRSRWGPLLPATTQQGLGHGGVCYHYPQRLGGPLSASSTAPCGQALPGLLCPSALRF